MIYIYISEPNSVISGCAGSGKTLLACHIAMRHSTESSVAILVYTKTLSHFIKSYINQYETDNINVYYVSEWNRLRTDTFDIIIVDEFQDLSFNFILSLQDKAKKGIYLFGDLEQKLYKQNMEKEKTVENNELLSLNGFTFHELKNNFRISKENSDFIKHVYKDFSIKDSNFSSGFIPQVLYFDHYKKEIEWIKFFLYKTTFNNIGILIKKNDSSEFSSTFYPDNEKAYDYGIMDLYNFLNENGLDVSYKYKSVDKLDFSKEQNINIMTYHSSKGLQFDCVLLPFSNIFNDFSSCNHLSYIGLTRATDQIIITYSNAIAKEFESYIPKSFYEGKIVNSGTAFKEADAKSAKKLEKELLDKFNKEYPGYENIYKFMSKD